MALVAYCVTTPSGNSAFIKIDLRIRLLLKFPIIFPSGSSDIHLMKKTLGINLHIGKWLSICTQRIFLRYVASLFIFINHGIIIFSIIRIRYLWDRYWVTIILWMVSSNKIIFSDFRIWVEYQNNETVQSPHWHYFLINFKNNLSHVIDFIINRPNYTA